MAKGGYPAKRQTSHALYHSKPFPFRTFPALQCGADDGSGILIIKIPIFHMLISKRTLAVAKIKQDSSKNRHSDQSLSNQRNFREVRSRPISTLSNVRYRPEATSQRRGGYWVVLWLPPQPLPGDDARSRLLARRDTNPLLDMRTDEIHE